MITKQTTADCTEPVIDADTGEWRLARFRHMITVAVPLTTLAENTSSPMWQHNCYRLMIEEVQGFFRCMPEIRWDPAMPKLFVRREHHRDCETIVLLSTGQFELSDDTVLTRNMLQLVSKPIRVTDSIRDVVVFG